MKITFFVPGMFIVQGTSIEVADVYNTSYVSTK